MLVKDTKEVYRCIGGGGGRGEIPYKSGLDARLGVEDSSFGLI